VFVKDRLNRRALGGHLPINPALTPSSPNTHKHNNSPRALLSLQPADASTARTVTPLAIEGGDSDSSGIGASAFPAAETGGAPAAALSFSGDAARPAATLLVVAAPLTTPAAAAGVTAGIARLIPAGADVAVLAALSGLRPPSGKGEGGGGGGAAVVADATTRVADPAVAALLHALAGCGHDTALVTVRGHRPTTAAGGEDGGLEAATALGGAAAARAPPGVLRFVPERAARLVPSLAAVRAAGGGGGEGGGGAPREPEAGGLLYC
jgi:hypothetical protein